MTGSMISGVSAFASRWGQGLSTQGAKGRGMFCQNTRGMEREVYRGDLGDEQGMGCDGFISAGRLSPRSDLKSKMRTPCERGMDMIRVCCAK